MIFPGPKIEEIKKTQSSEDYFASGGATETSLSVSALSWSWKGFSLAVGYSHMGHLGWCSHRAFIRVFASSGKQEEFEVEGCVSALSFMPGSNSLFVGTFNGVLLSWNLDTGDIVTRSSIDEYQHREAVTALAWVKSATYSLFSSSTDGKVLNWNQDNLDFPVRGVLLKTKNELEGVTCVSVSEDSAFIVIASESGKIFKYNIPVLMTNALPSDGIKIKPDAEIVLNNLNPTFRQQLLKTAGKYCIDVGQKEIDIKALFISKPDILKCYPSSLGLGYEKHDGPVSEVACNPFHRNLFASASFDGSVKVFNALQGRALLVLEPVLACKVLTVAWSEARPLVLAAGYDNGSVYVYDFLQSKTQFIVEIPNSRNSVSRIKFNAQLKDYVAVGYRNGDTKVFQLPEIFKVTHPDEVRRLGLLLESIMNE